MNSLPVFPPCTPGNFVPELRTLAPVNHKVNSHCHCDEDGDDNDYAKGTVGDNLIFLFHQRLKVLKNFSFFQFVNFNLPDAPDLFCIGRKKLQKHLTCWALRVRREIESTEAVDFQGNS